MKDFVERLLQRGRNLKGRFERRRVLFFFDGDDCLPRNPNQLRELLLRHFIAFKSQFADIVSYTGLCHYAPVL
jgi:hypothetical protein